MSRCRTNSNLVISRRAFSCPALSRLAISKRAFQRPQDNSRGLVLALALTNLPKPAAVHSAGVASVKG